MESGSGLQAVLTGIIGVVGGTVASLLGGWTEDLKTLLIFMAIDFLTGLLIAAVFQRSEKSETGALNSVSAWKGLCRKGVSLLVVLVADRLDLALGVDYMRTSVIIAFIANELISIVENVGVMGVPLPAVIVKAIDILEQRADTVQESDAGQRTGAGQRADAGQKADADPKADSGRKGRQEGSR